MKKFRSALAGAALVVTAGAAQAGIPVIDAANLMNTAAQVVSWGKQYYQMVEQINQLKAQYQELQRTYNSMTGNRGLGTLMNGAGDQAARRYLPEQAAQIDQLSAGLVAGYGPLQSAIANLKSQMSSMPAGTFGSGTEALNVLSAKINSLATQKALGQAAYSSAAQRTRDIENLIATTASATDQKAMGELQARISAQQALLQNESAKLQALAYMQSVDEQQAKQRALELVGKWSRPTLPAFSMD